MASYLWIVVIITMPIRAVVSGESTGSHKLLAFSQPNTIEINPKRIVPECSDKINNITTEFDKYYKIMINLTFQTNEQEGGDTLRISESCT